jgi:pyruvate ferredoxin oxidoreductase beta subunit
LSKIIEEKNIVLPGHRCCPGCAGAILHRMIFNVIGNNSIQYGRGGCGTPNVVSVPMMYQAHSGAGATGSTGVIAALKKQGKNETKVVGLAGDGAVSDTGFGKVGACASRNDDMFFFCFDNEAFMNTGIQQSRLTPFMAWTRTTPKGKPLEKKDMPMIIAQHKVPYVATLSVSHTADLVKKIKKGMDIYGFKYYHALNPCPTGWRSAPDKSVELARLAVETWVWPLFEITSGVFRLTAKPEIIPLERYLKLQGRYSHLDESEIKSLQKLVEEKRKKLLNIDGEEIII